LSSPSPSKTVTLQSPRSLTIVNPRTQLLTGVNQLRPPVPIRIWNKWMHSTATSYVGISERGCLLATA